MAMDRDKITSDEYNRRMKTQMSDEFKIENGEIPINLKTQCYYLKVCSCNGWIHSTCLNTWCLKTNKCPMCRTHMTKINKFVSIIIKNNWVLTTIYILYIRNMVSFFRFLFVKYL